MEDLHRSERAEGESPARTLLLDHGYWPTPGQRKRTQVPYLAVWVQQDVAPEEPWDSLPKALWEALEFWARAAGGIVRLFFGLVTPSTSVTFHTYASERTLDEAYSFQSRPHWDWCDDEGRFNYKVDDAGRAVVTSWFPDGPQDAKTYYLAWDESQNGYWASCLDECTYRLEDAVACTIPEAIALSEVFLEYEPFMQEKVVQRDLRLAEKEKSNVHEKQNIVTSNRLRPVWAQRQVGVF